MIGGHMKQALLIPVLLLFSHGLMANSSSFMNEANDIEALSGIKNLNQDDSLVLDIMGLSAQDMTKIYSNAALLEEFIVEASQICKAEVLNSKFCFIELFHDVETLAGYCHKCDPWDFKVSNFDPGGDGDWIPYDQI